MKKITLIMLVFGYYTLNAQVTLIPDATFEQVLINLNIDSDGIVNGQMLTSDAQNITQLNLYTGGSGFRIQNMTGIEAFANLETLEGDFHNFSKINLANLTKLKSLILPSNTINSINLLNNIDLEYLAIGNRDLEFFQYNTIYKLDLSNNTKLEYLNVVNLFDLSNINLKNHKAIKLDIYLGWSYSPFSNPFYYTVCIEVDDPIAATNKTSPYNNWEIITDNFVDYYFNDNCALSLEKFVNNNFTIFPNPATNVVTLQQKVTDGVHLQGIQILDSTGKWLHTVKNNYEAIDVSNLSKGLYYFIIQTDKGNKTEKVVIK